MMSSTKALSRALPLLLMTVLSGACTDTMSSEGEFFSVKMDRQALTLEAGRTTRLQLLSGGVPVGARTTWETSDASVARVDDQGTVEAVSPGVAVISGTVMYNARKTTASAEVKVKEGPARLTVKSGQGQSGRIATKLPEPLVVEVTHPSGQLVPNAEVTFTARDASGQAYLSVVATSGDDGLASAEWLLSTVAGPHTLTATVETQGNAAVVFEAEALPGDPVRLMPTGDGQTGATGSLLPDPLRVRVVDAFDNGVGGAPVSWNVQDGCGTLEGAATTADAEGYADAEWRLSEHEGEHHASAAAGTSTHEFTATAIVVDESVDRVEISGGNVTLSSLGGTTQLDVTAYTASGSVVSEPAVTWTSRSPDVATVSSSGLVTAMGNGTARILATVEDVADSTVITVDVPDETNTSVAGVEITKSVDAFTYLGQSALFEAQARDGSGSVLSGVTFAWSTSDPSIVTAAGDGTMTAKSIGTVLVIAAAAGVADTLAVSVRQDPASIQLSTGSLAMQVGETAQLSAAVKDAGGNTIQNATVTWSSSAPAVASVNGGLVSAVSAGSATVTAASGDITAQAAVTVTSGTTTVSPDGLPELPRVWVNTDWVEPTGQVIYVPAGGNLQSAINGANRGDVIELQAGATYTGNFTLPAKSGSGWIVIRTRGTLPAPGTRITPAHSSQLAKLVSTRSDDRVLTIEQGASQYRIVGLEITFASTVTSTNAVVDMKNGSSHIILDRSYVHGHSGLNLQRCVTMHAEHAAVIDSWLGQCHYKGSDSQAIVAWNTNGPLKIVNNHLEGAGENVMFGGATPSANTLPSDIEVRGNHFYKPQSWRDGSTSLWTVKNLFEIKFAQRVLLEGNVFDGNWRDGQDGHAFNIKLSAKGSGDRVEDITIRYNIIRNSEQGIKIVSPTTRLHMHDNLIYGIGGRMFTLLGANDLRLENNTGLHGGNIITSTGGHQRFIARGNIWGASSGYGVKGSAAEGTATLDADFPGWVYENNGHMYRSASRYPDNNKFVKTEADVRFVDAAGGDLRLRSDSPFLGLGADAERVLSMTAGVVK